MNRKIVCAVAVFMVNAMVAVMATAQPSPQFLYIQYCAGCHQMDGSGFPPEVPNLRSSIGKLLDSAGGRDYIVRVPGVTGVPFDEEQTARLLNWMVAEYYPERVGFTLPFTASELAAGRQRPIADPLGYRASMFPDLVYDE